MKCFAEQYLSEGKWEVLDLGAASSQSNYPGYSTNFVDERFTYHGLDMSAGDNVDIVPDDPNAWPIADNSIDVVICGQMFEHDPFFWLTTAQIARVLRPGGYFCAIAPSSGPAHGFPIDCWRFYGDAGGAICSWVGLEMLENYVEQPSSHRNYRTLCKLEHTTCDYQCDISGLEWCDWMLIAQKPVLSKTEQHASDKRLATILSLGSDFPSSVLADRILIGPAISAYEANFPPTTTTAVTGVFGWDRYPSVPVVSCNEAVGKCPKPEKCIFFDRCIFFPK